MSTQHDKRFISECERRALNWSKDPTTKVGAMIVNPNRIDVATGYNGFPRGIDDAPERLADRDTKLRLTIHAEMNALHNARELGVSVNGCTLYVWPMPCCHDCAKHLVQSGITRVVAPMPSKEHQAKWGQSMRWAHQIFAEAGVVVDYVEP